ncbi:MAG: 50S ribosomal protein L10 [Syntrophomonadaceae bacterium]|jgi:large subunit ribosomal protein L10|nr:50S ribosomal protein L10 [Syntrophomonadaceae bacterium]MDH7497773.1 50S ribosomal protein L10 [Syntrophomonadaceae bacterium]
MPNIEEKQKVVEELKNKLQQAQVVLFTDYRGLNVTEMSELRNRLRAAGVELKVYKNTMTRFALKGAGLEHLLPLAEGPNALVFGYRDPVDPAKLVRDFIKERKKMAIKGGCLGAKELSVEEVEALASLPPKDVVLGQVLGGMRAPLYGLVTVLNANLTGLVRVLDAIREQKQAS